MTINPHLRIRVSIELVTVLIKFTFRGTCPMFEGYILRLSHFEIVKLVKDNQTCRNYYHALRYNQVARTMNAMFYYENIVQTNIYIINISNIPE